MAQVERQLSANELEFYRENGYVRVEQLITPAEVRQLSDDYDAAVAGEFGDLRWEGRRVEGLMVQLGNAQRVIKHWRTHSYMRNASAIARQLEGEDVAYAYDQLIMKPPHYAKDTEWHQVSPVCRMGSVNGSRSARSEQTLLCAACLLAGCWILAERSSLYVLARAITRNSCFRGNAVHPKISPPRYSTTC